MSQRNRCRAALVGALGMSALLLAATAAGAADVKPGGLTGTWRLSVTVVSVGAPGAKSPPTTPGGTSNNPLLPPTGHTGSVDVTFTPVCRAGACTLDITPAPGAGSEFDRNYSPTGFALPSAGGGPNIASGGRLTFPGFGGFGGPCKGFTPPFEFKLTGKVTSTRTVNGAVAALRLTGQELLIVSAKDCAGANQVARLSFTGVNVSLLQSLGAGAPGPSPTAAPPTAHPAAKGDATGSLHRRSTLTAALSAPAEIFGSPVRDLVNIGIALAAMLFITFPANLFNKTFEENYADIAAFWDRHLGPVGRRLRSLQEQSSVVRARVAYVATIVAGALLGAELNPHTTFDVASATNITATLLTITVSTLIGFGVAVAYRRAQSIDVSAHVHALPGGLFVAAVCVLMSRTVGFRPGYLYGVVTSVAFAKALERHQSGQLIALSQLTKLLVAVGAWLVWVPVNHAAARPGSSLALVGVDDVLGALFVGGLVGGTISLIPLSFMPGRALAAWHKGAWSALFGVTAFGLVAAMLNPRSTNVHPGHAPVVTAIVLLVGFGGGSVLFTAYWAAKKRKAPAAEAETAAATEPAAAEPDAVAAASTALPAQRAVRPPRRRKPSEPPVK